MVLWLLPLLLSLLAKESSCFETIDATLSEFESRHRPLLLKAAVAVDEVSMTVGVDCCSLDCHPPLLPLLLLCVLLARSEATSSCY